LCRHRVWLFIVHEMTSRPVGTVAGLVKGLARLCFVLGVARHRPLVALAVGVLATLAVVAAPGVDPRAAELCFIKLRVFDRRDGSSSGGTTNRSARTLPCIAAAGRAS
jgi:hypothetical protein